MNINSYYPLLQIFRHSNLNNNFLRFFVYETKITIPVIFVYRYVLDLKNYVYPEFFFLIEETLYQKKIRKIIIWSFSPVYISPYKTFEFFNSDIILFDDRFMIRSLAIIERKELFEKIFFFLISFIDEVDNFFNLFIKKGKISEVEKSLIILVYQIIEQLHNPFFNNYVINYKEFVLERLINFIFQFNIKLSK